MNPNTEPFRYTPERGAVSEPEPRGMPGLRDLLAHDHAALEHRFETLLEACRVNARDDAAEAWTGFEQALASHLDFEESFIFPSLRRCYPAEFERLSNEHQHIRNLLNEMAVEVDLHLIRLWKVDAFVSLLRRHARREDELTYRWAEATLAEPWRTAAIERAPRLLGSRPGPAIREPVSVPGSKALVEPAPSPSRQR